MDFLRRVQQGLEGRYVDRRPVAVLFSLPLLLPIAAVFLVGGVAMALATPVPTSDENALRLLPVERQEPYLIDLLLLHINCKQSLRGDAICIDEDTRSTNAAVQTFEDAIAQADLTGCQMRDLRADDSFGSDLFVCPGPPEPSQAFTVGFALLFVLSLFGLGYIVYRASVSRPLIPRYYLRLWITPTTLVAIVTVVAPTFASFLVLSLRSINGFPQPAEVASGTGLGLLILALLLAGTLVADLRTFEPERMYGAGLLVLILVGGAGAILLFLVLGIINGRLTGFGVLSLTLCLGVSLLIALWYVARHPRAPAIAACTRAFLLRWLLMNAVTLVALVVHQGSDWSVELPGVVLTPPLVTLSLLVLSFIWSNRAERLIQTGWSISIPNPWIVEVDQR